MAHHEDVTAETKPYPETEESTQEESADVAKALTDIPTELLLYIPFNLQDSRFAVLQAALAKQAKVQRCRCGFFAMFKVDAKGNSDLKCPSCGFTPFKKTTP